MDKYIIKVCTCNQELQLNVSSDTEKSFRAAAKQANNVYAYYKGKYDNASEEQLLSFLFLIMTERAMKADGELQEAKKRKTTFMMRLKMFLAQILEA